jgi:hypothetical protein
MDRNLNMGTPVSKRAFRNLSTVVGAMAVSCLLAACGGGGSDGAGAPAIPAPIDPLSLKGRWVTVGAAAPAFTAIVVPEGANAGAWVLANDASRLVRLLLRSDNTAEGKSYVLNPAGTAAVDVSGSFTADLAASPSELTINGVPAVTLALSQSATLAAAAVQGDAAGTWTATLGGGAQTTQWVVTGSGSMTGTSTTGCTYAGIVVAMVNAAAYNVSFTESCPVGVPAAFSGIATVNAGLTALTVVSANADASVGSALFFAR